MNSHYEHGINYICSDMQATLWWEQHLYIDSSIQLYTLLCKAGNSHCRKIYTKFKTFVYIAHLRFMTVT